MQFLEHLFKSISPLALPSACITCQSVQSKPICDSCLQLLESNGLIQYECCRQCGIPLKQDEVIDQQCTHCLSYSPSFDETHCLDRYDGILRNALHQLKYQKRIAVAHGLAEAWNRIQHDCINQYCPDYLMPVPLSSQKLLARGFNQSWEIARRIRCNEHIQKLPHVLKRHHRTDDQANKSRYARQEAVRGLFYVDPRYQDYLEGKTVVVFDDVMTSGATLNEIACTLKHTGVLRVINWVLLRTTIPV